MRGIRDTHPAIPSGKAGGADLCALSAQSETRRASHSRHLLLRGCGTARRGRPRCLGGSRTAAPSTRLKAARASSTSVRGSSPSDLAGEITAEGHVRRRPVLRPEPLSTGDPGLQRDTRRAELTASRTAADRRRGRSRTAPGAHRNKGRADNRPGPVHRRPGMARADTATRQLVSDILLPSLPIGAGLGLIFVTITSESVAGIHADQTGLAGGLINATQQIGGAIGLAVITAVATSYTSGAAHSPTNVVHGFQAALLVAAGLAAAAMVLATILVPPASISPRPQQQRQTRQRTHQHDRREGNVRGSPTQFGRQLDCAEYRGRGTASPSENTK